MSQLVEHSAGAVSPRWGAIGGEDAAVAILALVSARSGVVLAKVRRPDRGSSSSVLAHQLAVYLAVVGLDWTSTRAAAYFARDRKTICSALARIEDLRERDRALDAFCEGVERRFYIEQNGGADGART